ncbi:hypothetical protein F373_gp211 [Bacillus phage SP-10]|uniref:hypothetical protein n=1 Tax=Bacillus phage SP10 TaxID=941058 RepID=UPI0002198BA7|nr:hypothetical protein F373_gp211 [Bacillus phage SP-10]BAK53023.1 hypothetical protein [Bacillus phage SP-10]
MSALANTIALLKAEMRRALEILESKGDYICNVEGVVETRYSVHEPYVWTTRDKETAELRAKLREIRRDSIRLEKEIFTELPNWKREELVKKWEEKHGQIGS